MKDQQYILVVGSNASELELKVGDLIKKDFRPFGGLIWIESNGVLIQPMVERALIN